MKMEARMWILTALAVTALGVQAGQISQQPALFASYQDTDDASGGFGGGLKYAVYFDDDSGLGVGVDLRGSWLTEFDDADDLDVYPVEMTLLLRYAVLDGTLPYIGAGAGYYFFDEDDAGVDDEFGYYGVVGVDQAVSDGVSVFVEGKYLWLEPDSDFGDVTLDGFGVNAGVALSW